ncbi:MAG: 4Fe-4S dicluster domain-containing protein [Tannerella sp.]|nr:4Fe-4S dicluster domain-containing protein [Tannerella sp.]
MVYYIVGGMVLLWMLGGIHRHRRGRNKVARVIEANCTGCACCLKWCNHKALEPVSDENGKRIAVKHPDKCTGCGKCVAACKFNALEITTREFDVRIRRMSAKP